MPNDAVVAFAATVTDPGTVSPASPVLLRLTTAPLDPAAVDSVTVQFPLALAPNVVGLHCREEMTTGVELETVIVEPVPVVVYASPASVAPSVLMTPTDVRVALGESVTVRTANTPPAIVFVLMPVARHL